MPARKRRGTKDNPWSEKTRERIKISMLVERLQKFALGQKGPQDEEIEMSPAQVKAVQVLLDRVLPVLSAQDLMHHSDLSQDYSEEELITMAAQALGLTGEEVVMLIKRKTQPAIPETLN